METVRPKARSARSWTFRSAGLRCAALLGKATTLQRGKTKTMAHATELGRRRSGSTKRAAADRRAADAEAHRDSNERRPAITARSGCAALLRIVASSSRNVKRASEVKRSTPSATSGAASSSTLGIAPPATGVLPLEDDAGETAHGLLLLRRMEREAGLCIGDAEYFAHDVQGV